MAPAPTRYEGTMHLLPVVEGNKTFLEWKVRARYRAAMPTVGITLFQSWIWTGRIPTGIGPPDLPENAGGHCGAVFVTLRPCAAENLTPSGVRYRFNVSQGTKAT